MSLQKMNTFRDALRSLSWRNVTQSQNVNESYNIFWEDTLHDLHFPEKTVSFSRNLHKINPFMTKGLLISRKTKNLLHKTAVTERSEVATSRFKQYRNIYSSLIRQSKKLYYHSHIAKNRKNPKKIWQLLKEVLVGSKNPKIKLRKLLCKGNPLITPKKWLNILINSSLKLAKRYRIQCFPLKN